MEAIELRIGNWYYEFGLPKQVDPNLILKLYQIELAEKTAIDVTPIPLTEEWLLKFGFEKGEDTWYDLGQISVSFTLERMIYITYDFQENEIYHELPFKEFVHDFQNLVYALTNEELKINS